MKELKKSKKSRILGASAILVAIMLAATACSTNNNSNNEQSPSTEPTPVVSATPGASNNGGLSDPDTASPDAGNSTENGTEDNNVGSAPKDAEAIQGEGTFVGLADTHTVEIETADGAESFQFEDSLTDTINSIEGDANVTFEYVEKKVEAGDQTITQLWLTKIEAK